MHQNSSDSLNILIHKERSLKMIQDHANLHQKSAPHQLHPNNLENCCTKPTNCSCSNIKRKAISDPVKPKKEKRRLELQRIIGLKITPSDLKALVEWKDATEEPSWESIQNFSRINHFLEESSDFDAYFRSIMTQLRPKFVRPIPGFQRLCKRTYPQDLGFYNYSSLANAKPSTPNLVSYFSSKYFPASTTSQFKQKVSKKRKIFYYVRDPQSVESSNKSDTSSQNDNSLSFNNHKMISSFVGCKSCCKNSFELEDDDVEDSSSNFKGKILKERTTVSPQKQSPSDGFEQVKAKSFEML